MKIDAEQRIIAQVELVGDEFSTPIKVKRGEGTVKFHLPHRVRIISAVEESTGDTVFIKTSEAPITPSDYHKLPLADATSIYDISSVSGRSLETVRRSGASQSGVNMDEIYSQRGGDPSYRYEKKGGFFLKKTPAEIAEVRRLKKLQSQQRKVD